MITTAFGPGNSTTSAPIRNRLQVNSTLCKKKLERMRASADDFSRDIQPATVRGKVIVLSEVRRIKDRESPGD